MNTLSKGCSKSSFTTVSMIGVVALVIAACGGNGTGSGSEGNGAEDGQDGPEDSEEQTDDDSPLAGTWEEILAAAEQEGEIVLAVPAGAGYVEWVNHANEALPFEVNATTIPASEFVPRAVAEQQGGQFLWDVHMGPNATVLSTLNPADGLEDIRPWLDALPDEVKQEADWAGGFEWFADETEQHNFIHQFTLSGGTWINRDLAPESELSSPEDLLDPKWRGQIVIYDPARPAGGASSLSWFLAQGYGEDFVRTLIHEQEAMIVDSQVTVIEWLADGRAAIGFGGFWADLLPLQAEGIGESVVQELEFGGYLTTFTSIVLKNPPNPNATAVFLAWALSQEGQELWAQLSRGDASSRRTDVTVYNPESTPDPDRLETYGALIGTADGAPLLETIARIARE